MQSYGGAFRFVKRGGDINLSTKTTERRKKVQGGQTHKIYSTQTMQTVKTNSQTHKRDGNGLFTVRYFVLRYVSHRKDSSTCF